MNLLEYVTEKQRLAELAWQRRDSWGDRSEIARLRRNRDRWDAALEAAVELLRRVDEAQDGEQASGIPDGGVGESDAGEGA